MATENHDAMRSSMVAALAFASRVQLPGYVDLDDSYVRCATERDRLLSFVSYLQSSVARFDPETALMLQELMRPVPAEHKRPS